MKRDDELVRKILLALEAAERRASVGPLEGYDVDVFRHHCYLLAQAGLIEAIEQTCLDSPWPVSRPICLTWAGHEFLAAARDDERWHKARGIASTAGGVSLQVMTALLTSLTMKAVGLA